MWAQSWAHTKHCSYVFVYVYLLVEYGFYYKTFIQTSLYRALKTNLSSASTSQKLQISSYVLKFLVYQALGCVHIYIYISLIG